MTTCFGNTVYLTIRHAKDIGPHQRHFRLVILDCPFAGADGNGFQVDDS
jgi:hypothetical protein